MKLILAGPLRALTILVGLASFIGCTRPNPPTQPEPEVATYTVHSDPPPPPQPPPWKPLPPRGSIISLSEYSEPPKEVIQLLEREPNPTIVLHAPSKRLIRLYEQPLVPMSQLSRPRFGLAGLRIDPENHTQGTGALFTRMVLSELNNPDLRMEVPAPSGALIEDAYFSPDGTMVAVSLVYSDRTQLGIVDAQSGEMRIVPTGPLSAVWTEPCNWIARDELLCARPQYDGTPPSVDVKPNIQELVGGAAAAFTYSNLLRDSNDDLLLEHFGGVELFLINIKTDEMTALPGSGLIMSASISPNRRYLMTERIERPYPRFLPASRFQRQLVVHEVETGAVSLRISSNDDTEISTSVPWGPRRSGWDPRKPDTLLYVYRARKEGAGDKESLVARRPPFESTSEVLADDLFRVKTWGVTSGGSLYLVDLKGRGWVTYKVDKSLKQLSEGHEDSPIGDLSRAFQTHGNRGRVLENKGRFYFITEEINQEDIHYRLSEWDSQSGVTRPLWRNLRSEHASVFAVVDPEKRDYLIRSETPAIAPYLVMSESGKRRAVTHPAAPILELAGVTRQQIFYRRADSVFLSAMLYLPANFRPGKRLPTVFWIYPRDYNDEEHASQLSEDPRRYFDVRGPSRFALLTQGYALVDTPSMPIVGEVTSGRDDYLPQLVQSAEAAIDYLVELGISERDNIAVIGRSYGAFAVANLMAHTTLFKTGIAISGAYNRTLTPFGFQKQTRTFWQNTEAYVNLSPFFFADKIEGSLLLLHGQDDDNPGTPAFQSERFYAALAGNGIKSRYVSFPYEGHQFRGRRTVLHASAEMINWLDRHMTLQPTSTEPGRTPSPEVQQAAR